MLAIYKKELRSYFNSMIGYVFLALFLVIIGIYFFVQLLNGFANFEYTLSSLSIFFVLSSPLLTMRLMAEENKQKTDQLLYTAPVSAASIVIGKLLAVITLFGIVMLITCTYPLILSLYGTVPFASAYSAILAFSLMGAAYLSIGLFISSLTDSQIVAAVITYVLFVFTFFMDGIASFFPSDNKTALGVFTVLLLIICVILYKMMQNLTVAVLIGLAAEAVMVAVYFIKPTLFDGSIVNVFGWLSVVTRFDNFYMGVFDVSGLVYYISIICLFAFLTIQSIRKKRWS